MNAEAQMDQFAHDSAEGGHFAFTAILQTEIKCFEMWVMLSAYDGSHIQNGANTSGKDCDGSLIC